MIDWITDSLNSLYVADNSQGAHNSSKLLYSGTSYMIASDIVKRYLKPHFVPIMGDTLLIFVTLLESQCTMQPLILALEAAL